MPILSFAKLGYCFVKQPDMIPRRDAPLDTVTSRVYDLAQNITIIETLCSADQNVLVKCLLKPTTLRT